MNVVRIWKTITSNEGHCLNKRLHRLNQDKPAFIFWYGYQQWYRNGLAWRENGYALIYADGSSYCFFKDGQRA